MKHLKKFNESITSFKEELQEYCNDNLAYLIDNGFKVTVYEYQFYNLMIDISKGDEPFDITFNFNDISDDLIPFVKILKTKYIISPLGKGYIIYHLPFWSDFKSITISELEEDIDKYDINVLDVRIIVKQKKEK